MFNWLKRKSYSTVPSGWSSYSIKEPFAGAWQRNIEWKRDTVLAFHAIFSCTTLIASDISKLPLRKVKRDSEQIWVPVPLKEHDFLEKPNKYQNRIQFMEQWVTSKLTRGNTYVLKGRDGNGKVKSLQILSPDLVLPLVTDAGDVYYQLGQDNLTGVQEAGLVVPASEIIHDRFNCLFHPLVGLPPIFASGLAGYQGLKIQENSAKFFNNMSRPSGILTAPGAISAHTADRLKEDWEANFGSGNMGRTAVLGDGLNYQAMAITAEQAELVEQLKITAEIVCSTFHVPKFKVGGDYPSYNNVEALEVQYLGQCLQKLIEDIELCLDQGLDMPEDMGFEFDLDGLLRMDTATQVKTLAEAVKGGLDTPNEARKKLNQKPLPGGSTVYLQQQMYSLEALAKRDAKEDPFSKDAAPPAPAEVTGPADDPEKSLLTLALMVRKELLGAENAVG